MLFGICSIDVNTTDVFLQYRRIILGIPYRFIAINIQLVPILLIGKTSLSFSPFFKIQIQVFSSTIISCYIGMNTNLLDS